MKVITANRLGDGVAVYLTADSAWAERLADAYLFEDDAAAAGPLSDAEAREDLVVGPYIMDAEPGGVASGQKVIRESIRAAGPTVRRDLGKQADGLAPPANDAAFDAARSPAKSA